MTPILLAAICAAIVLPHVIELRRVPASIAVSLWAVALGLRAALGLTLVLCVVLLVPTTAPFATLTDWCWHAALPLLTTHLGLEGHRLGGALTVLPGVLLALSASSISSGSSAQGAAPAAWWRAARWDPAPRCGHRRWGRGPPRRRRVHPDGHG